jgi:hypothetical protein
MLTVAEVSVTAGLATAGNREHPSRNAVGSIIALPAFCKAPPGSRYQGLPPGAAGVDFSMWLPCFQPRAESLSIRGEKRGTLRERSLPKREWRGIDRERLQPASPWRGLPGKNVWTGRQRRRTACAKRGRGPCGGNHPPQAGVLPILQSAMGTCRKRIKVGGKILRWRTAADHSQKQRMQAGCRFSDSATF